MNMEDMQLIMENWRKYSESGNTTTIYLFEGSNQEPKKVCFENIIDNYDHKELHKLWEKSYLYECQQILNEGLLDIISSAYEKTKDGVVRLKTQVSDVVRQAMEKVNNFFLEKSVQVYNLVKKGGELAVKALGSFLKQIALFKQKHPILFKTMMAIGIIIIVFFIMSSFAREASAAIKSPLDDAKEVSDKGVRYVRGLVKSVDFSPQLQSDILKTIDDAHKANEVVDLSKLTSRSGKLANTALRVIFNSAEVVKGDEYSPELKQQASSWLSRAWELGKTVTSDIDKLNQQMQSLGRGEGGTVRIWTDSEGVQWIQKTYSKYRTTGDLP